MLQKKEFHLQSIKVPSNVKVLILTENKTSPKEFYLINSFVNLIKLDLSYNRLIAFPKGFTFHSFYKLRTLFLHYNKFSSLKNLVIVSESNSLIYLTLFGNPLQQAKTRHFFVNEMPSLMLMDDKIVKFEERNSDLVLKDVTSPIISFPLVASPNQGQVQKFLESVLKELHLIRKHYLQTNRIIRIQRWWKRQCRKNRRGWKIIEKQEKQKLSYIEEQKVQLQRLITEKYPIDKSYGQKINSIFSMNQAFWKTICQQVNFEGIYLTKDYCQKQGISYQFTNLIFFKRKQPQKFMKLNHLKFFLALSQSMIIMPLTNKNKSNKKSSIVWYNLKHTISQIKKMQLQTKKSSLLSVKLKDQAQKKNKIYVIPKISYTQCFQIVKKCFSEIRKEERKDCPFLIKAMLKRSISSVIIQRIWRGYIVRKKIQLHKKITERECAIRIQRWIRNLPFIHRHKFLLEINLILRQDTSNYIILEGSQLFAIESYCQYKQNQGINFNIPFQKCSFQISKDEVSTINNEYEKIKIVSRAERRPNLDYLNVTIKNRKNQSSSNQISNKKSSSVLDIIVKQASEIQKIKDHKGLLYFKFNYTNTQEAKNRKFILALKTYRMAYHQFIHSLQVPGIVATSNMFDEIASNNIIFIYKDQSTCNSFGQSQKSSLNHLLSRSTLNSEINMFQGHIVFRIKFYHNALDLSCLFLIKNAKLNSKDMRIMAINSSDVDLLSKKYYEYRKNKSSRRYEQHDQKSTVSISRNIINLNQVDPPRSHRLAQNLAKILNTDQSHTQLSGSISPQNSLSKLNSINRMQSYDRFDKEVYPPITENMKESFTLQKHIMEVEEMRQKKQKIEKIKSHHQQRILAIAQQKASDLDSLRKYNMVENQVFQKKLQEVKKEIKDRQIKKHDIVKEHVRSHQGSFQIEFLKNGNKSIKKQLTQFEKKSKSMKKKETHFDLQLIEKMKKKDIFKTQIKQFSINIMDDSGWKQIEQAHSEEGERLREKLKKQINIYVSRQGSIKSQHSQNQLEQKKLSQEKIQIDRQKQLERKKMRKKRLVHSVFPEEFYPLKQSHAIGFELPRLKK